MAPAMAPRPTCLRNVIGFPSLNGVYVERPHSRYSAALSRLEIYLILAAASWYGETPARHHDVARASTLSTVPRGRPDRLMTLLRRGPVSCSTTSRRTPARFSTGCCSA